MRGGEGGRKGGLGRAWYHCSSWEYGIMFLQSISSNLASPTNCRVSKDCDCDSPKVSPPPVPP